MALYQFKAVCRYCGAVGTLISRPVNKTPSNTPRVPGKCKAHPSGKPNMPHSPRWEMR